MSSSEQGRRRHKRWSERSTAGKVFIITAVIVGIAAMAALVGAITMLLWDALMPAIFSLPRIGFWQALGLVVLAHILFKGGRGAHAARAPWKRRQVWQHLHEEDRGGQEA